MNQDLATGLEFNKIKNNEKPHVSTSIDKNLQYFAVHPDSIIR